MKKAIVKVLFCPACLGTHEVLANKDHVGSHYDCAKAGRSVQLKYVGSEWSTLTQGGSHLQWNPFGGYLEELSEQPEAASSDTVVTNTLGGKQSDTGTRFDLMPPKAIHEVAKVLKRGAEKYGEDNWHAISTREHLEHMIRHAYLYLAGDTTEDHLANVGCRSLMALEIKLMGGPKKKEGGS